MKKLRQFEMHYEDGEFANIYELYNWLGEIGIDSSRHKFQIDVTIIEYKED